MEQYDGSDLLQNNQEPVESQEPIQEEVQQVNANEIQKEQNLRILRERAQAAEQRAKELEYYLQQNMNQNKPSVKMEIEEDDIDVSDDSYIEGYQFKKYVRNLKNEFKKTTAQLQEMTQRSAIEQAELKLRSDYPDLNQVVNEENLFTLSKLKPSLYRSIMATNDLYDRGSAAYEMIKNSGIVQEYTPVDRRIDQNKSKPRSAASVAPQSSETPLARAGDYDRRILTPEYKERLLRQVAEAKYYS